MKSKRVLKVERELQRIISEHLLRYYRNNFDGLVTVSRIIVSGDLRTAKAYLSVMGEGSNMEDTVDSLNENARDFQSTVNKQLAMKFCPKIKFYPDEVFGAAIDMDRKLFQIAQELESKEI